MTEQKSGRKRNIGCAFWAALFVILLVGGLAIFKFVITPIMINSFFAGNTPPPVTVSTATVEEKNWQPLINGIGTVVAVRGVDITAEAPGIVSEILFESGQDVDANAPLIHLNDEVERAELEQNLALLKEANLELERSRSLATRGNVSQASLDASLARRDSAAAAVERTRALISQKNVHAPFAGRLGVRRVNLGAFLSPGDPIVTLQSLDPLYVNFTLPEQALAVLKVGQKLDIAVDAFPGERFPGEITSLNSRVTDTTRNILIQATLANPEKKLVPGMFASIRLFYRGEEMRMTVPETAITYSLYGDSIYVVTPVEGEDGLYQVERRTVQVSDKRPGEISLSEGVSPNEEVVVAGQIKLRPGAVVKVDNSKPLEPASPRPKL
ncbi:MAG: efflux RND transporter periplasmic adaptor subunit [Sphingomonadales bacterium]|jgi:membrane fusion protein (multidrug efflux system)